MSKSTYFSFIGTQHKYKCKNTFMTNPIKKLQTNLAKDLVKMETTAMDQKKQKMITKAYTSVYKLISSADKKKK